MARCEDFPCCGHEAGCCPNYENGRQIDMVCVCGARLPINNRYSICNTCLNGDFRDYDNMPDGSEIDYLDEMPDREDCFLEEDEG